MASKVLSRKRANDTSNACTVSKGKEMSVLDDEDMKFKKPPKIPAAKLLSKLNIGGIGSHGKEKDENIQQYCPTDTPISNEVITQPNPPRDLKATTSYHCTVYAESEAENPHKRNSPCAAKRENSYELEPDSQNSKSLEIENAVQQQPDPQQHSSSAGSIGSNHGSLSRKGDNESNLVVDYEIHWDDLQLREEIGQVDVATYDHLQCDLSKKNDHLQCGRGSFASVYHGIWNGSDVAVRVYFGNEYGEGTLLDYKKEIDIMRRLRHPNVLLFMGAVYSGEQEKLAIVSEFLPRGSLFKTLHKNNQSFDIRRRLRMALDVARGMNYLHHRNPPIVHRDLKSSNLLVDKNWTVKVGDFGLSKLKHATFLTATSGRGTPQWMAPEVLRNEPSNEKSDVFSFGVILWELMTESIPWNNLNSLQVVGIVGFMDRRLDLPENMDPKVASVIRDCWQSNPGHRPSFEDLILRMIDLIQTVVAPVRRSSETYNKLVV
ncbi:unnamed protein product [Camellia sinensis]